MKKTFSVVGALFFAVSIAACGGSKKDETTTPATTPPPAEGAPMAADGGAPTSMAPTGNPCSTGATAAGNPCAKPQ